MDIIIQMNDGNSVQASQLREAFSRMNVVDAAGMFEDISDEYAALAFRLLPVDVSADAFSYISSEKQQIITKWLTDAEISRIMNELFVDDAADFVEDMPPDIADRALGAADAEKRQIITEILAYPEDSAGSIMTTEFVELSKDMTAREALDAIRVSGVDKETIYTCYMTDAEKRLIGVLSADDLVRAELTTRIGDIMDKNVISVRAADDRELVAGMFRKYGFLVMPVTDGDDRLAGIVTVDDILNIIDEKNTEDFEKIAAVNPSDDSYMKTGVIKQAKNRIAWLMILMLSATITGMIITEFENAMAVLPALGLFFPMLMGAGGNAGSQSATVVIRGMALGEILIKDVIRVLWREMRIGLICGLALGAANFVRIFLMNGRDATLSLVVTLSLCATLVAAKSIGCTLPILAKKLRLDPALMAAPLITTIVDCLALMMYFSIARVAFGL